MVQRTQDVYANADSPLDSSQVCAVVMDSTGTAVQSSSAECANGTSPVGPLPSSDPPDDTQPGSCYVMVWAAKPTNVNWLVHTTTVTLTAQSVAFYERDLDASCTYEP